MNEIITVFEDEPALVTSFLQAAAVLVAAFVTTVTQSQEAAIVTIGSALVTVLVCALTRPVKVPILVGAVLTGLTAAAAFGLKLQPSVLASFSTILTLTLNLVLRGHVTAMGTLRRAAPSRPVAPPTV